MSTELALDAFKAALKTRGFSLRAAGERLGVSHSLVALWRDGRSVPDSADRVRIEETLGVPRGWPWSRPVEAPAPLAAPEPPPVASEPGAAPPRAAVDSSDPLGSVLEESRAQVERLRAMQREAVRDGSTLTVRVQIERELRQALAALADVTGELTPDEETRLLDSDAWREIERALVRAVESLPPTTTRAEVARALASALDSLTTPSRALPRAA